MQITIKSLQLDGHNVSVPCGLDTALSNGNGWGVKAASHQCYKREVVKRDGRMFIILTKEE